jgi:3-oxoacyl-[acyl-carrier protein] reductase
LVNNACQRPEPGGLDQVDASQLDRHYAVNVRGTAPMCQAFVRQRRQRRRGGRIISLTSGQGAGPMVRELAYVVTKAAVDARPSHWPKSWLAVGLPSMRSTPVPPTQGG